MENSLEQVPEMEAACEEEAVGNPEADAETAQNTPEESDGNTERQDAQAVNGTAADQNGETGSGETAANEETSAASGTVDSAENQETAVETAGAAQDLMFSEATIMELPVTGTVLIRITWKIPFISRHWIFTSAIQALFSRRQKELRFWRQRTEKL